MLLKRMSAPGRLTSRCQRFWQDEHFCHRCHFDNVQLCMVTEIIIFWYLCGPDCDQGFRIIKYVDQVASLETRVKYDKGLVDATGGDTEVICLIFIFITVDMLKIIRIISVIILVDATGGDTEVICLNISWSSSSSLWTWFKWASTSLQSSYRPRGLSAGQWNMRRRGCACSLSRLIMIDICFLSRFIMISLTYASH